MAAPKWAGLAFLMLVSLGSIVSAQRKVAEEPKWRTYSEFGNSRAKDTKLVDDEKFVLGGHFSLGHGIKIDPQPGSGGFKAAATGGGFGKGGGYGSGGNLGIVRGGWSVGGSANIGGGTLGSEGGGWNVGGGFVEGEGGGWGGGGSFSGGSNVGGGGGDSGWGNGGGGGSWGGGSGGSDARGDCGNCARPGSGGQGVIPTITIPGFDIVGAINGQIGGSIGGQFVSGAAFSGGLFCTPLDCSGNDCSGVRLFFDKSNNHNNPHTAPKTMAGSNGHKQYINHETEDRHIVHPIKVNKPPPTPKLTEPLAPQRINMPPTPPPSPQNGMAKLTPVAG